MTVSATTSSKDFAGNNTTGPFSFTFRFLDNDDISAYITAIDGTVYPITETTDYTLTGAGTYTGGSLTLTGVALPVGATLTVYRQTSNLQEVSIRQQGGNFNPATHEEVFDRLAMSCQDLRRDVDRSLKVPLSSAMTESEYLTACGAARTGAEAAEDAAVVAKEAVEADIAAFNLSYGGLGVGPFGFRNHIINGAMMINQRAASYNSIGIFKNNDDSYCLDRWYLLSDGNNITDVASITDVAPAGGLYAWEQTVKNINKKFGFAQIIEQANCTGLFGQTVTLSFKAAVNDIADLDCIKAAVISWTGTRDVVTSDIVSTWNIEGTNPTLIADCTYENVPVNLNVIDTYGTYSITCDIDTASAKNIIVFIWSDVTATTVGSKLYVTDVQLERGSVATPFEHRPVGLERDLCQRYCPVLSSMGGVGILGSGSIATATTAIIYLPLPTKPRVRPTGITLRNILAKFGISNTETAGTPTEINFVAASSSYVKVGVGWSGGGTFTANQVADLYTADEEVGIVITGCEM